MPTICMGGQCLQQDEIDMLKLGEPSDDAEDGYIFEVDLHCSTHLYVRHDDYSLAPESLVIDRSMYIHSASGISRNHTSKGGKVRSTLS